MEVKSSAQVVLGNFYKSDIEGVVLWSDNFFSSYISKELNSKLSTTKDRLFGNDVVLYFRKKSALKDVFNEKLQRMSESGVTEFFIKGYVNDRKEKVGNRLQLKFYFENIVGALRICVIMYLISFIVFCLEVISLVYPRIKFILDNLTY